MRHGADAEGGKRWVVLIGADHDTFTDARLAEEFGPPGEISLRSGGAIDFTRTFVAFLDRHCAAPLNRYSTVTIPAYPEIQSDNRNQVLVAPPRSARRGTLELQGD